MQKDENMKATTLDVIPKPGFPVDMNGQEFEEHLLDSIGFTLNEDGTVTEVPLSCLKGYLGSDYITFNFYDRTNGGTPYFKVVMTAVALPNHYFKRHVMQILPAGNWTKWFEHNIKHQNVSRFTDTMDYHYANGTPARFTVQVKGSVTTDLGTYTIPRHTLSNPK